MRKSIYFILIFLISLSLNGFAVSEKNPTQTEQKEIEYFQNKEYKGDKEIYTEANLYPPYFKEGEASTEDILRFLRLLRNEIFARKGYVFKSEDLKEFFGEMGWYEPKIEDVKLNQIEKDNVSRIQDEEKYKSGEEEIEGGTEEKYIPKVIIQAGWGDGPGEFGIEPLSESHEFMTYIDIAPNYNVYILDPNNIRINVFDYSGSFIKEIPIPQEFVHKYKEQYTSLVEAIGVDSENNLYIFSSSIISNCEVVNKIDMNGNVIERFKFKGGYLTPHIFEDKSGEIFLGGKWSVNKTYVDAFIPLELGKNNGIVINESLLSSEGSKSFNIENLKHKGKFSKRFIITEECVAAYFGGYHSYIVIKDLNGKIKAKIERPRIYPRGQSFSYRNNKVFMSAIPCFDKKMNFYSVEGTKDGLQVIKYIINRSIWE